VIEFFEFLTALLFAGFVLAAIFTAYVKMLKRAANRYEDKQEAATSPPDEVGQAPAHFVRFATPTLCDARPATCEPRDLDATEDLPEFHVEEDDWRQIEFLPTSLRDDLQDEIAAIEKFKIERWEGEGWADIYLRRDHLEGLPSIQLSFDELSKLFESWSRHDLSLVRENPDGATIAKVHGSFLYEASEESFFYGQQHDGSVAVLALRFFGQGRGSYSKLIEKLVEMGGAFPLLAVDWNSGIIVDLRSREEIVRWVDPIDDAT
jgi:hypothetical protein